DAARGNLRADAPRLVRAVDAVEGRAEKERAGAERIFRTASHVAREVRAALDHLVGRSPVRPFAHRRDRLHAGPGETRTADADAVAHGLAALLHQVKKAIRRVDDDGAGLLFAAIGDDLTVELRIDRRMRHVAKRRGRIVQHRHTERDRRWRRLRPVIRERRLVGTRRYKLARRTAEQELDEAAAKLRLTGLRIARPSGGGLRLSLHCCSPIGPLVRREGAGKELGRSWSGSAKAGRPDAPRKSAETRIRRIAELCTLIQTHRRTDNASARGRSTGATSTVW